MAFQNRSLHQNSASLDHVLTKVNAGQTCMETLATTVFPLRPFPTCEPKLPSRARTKSEEEMMCEDEMMRNVLQC